MSSIKQLELLNKSLELYPLLTLQTIYKFYRQSTNDHNKEL